MIPCYIGKEVRKIEKFIQMTNCKLIMLHYYVLDIYLLWSIINKTEQTYF